MPSHAFTDWRKSRMSQYKYSALYPRPDGLNGLGSIPDLGKRFFFPPQLPERLWGPPRGSFSGVKRPESEARRSPFSNVEVKNSGTIPTPWYDNWLSTGATFTSWRRNKKFHRLSRHVQLWNWWKIKWYLLSVSKYSQKICRLIWYHKVSCRFIWKVLSDYEEDEGHIQDILQAEPH
jgi:hypothetical protein